jgi:hypothetical protein
VFTDPWVVGIATGIIAAIITTLLFKVLGVSDTQWAGVPFHRLALTGGLGVFGLLLCFRLWDEEKGISFIFGSGAGRILLVIAIALLMVGVVSKPGRPLG